MHIHMREEEKGIKREGVVTLDRYERGDWREKRDQGRGIAPSQSERKLK